MMEPVTPPSHPEEIPNMEPIVEPVAVAAAVAEPSPNRLKAVLAAFAIAGVLTAWGAANVFAASPGPSASPSASTHNCPAHSSTSTSS